MASATRVLPVPGGPWRRSVSPYVYVRVCVCVVGQEGQKQEESEHIFWSKIKPQVEKKIK